MDLQKSYASSSYRFNIDRIEIPALNNTLIPLIMNKSQTFKDAS